MPLLPPAEKLPLAVRKNVRDEWENNKADIEKRLSDLLGETWTCEATPNSIWPYHNDGYAKESLGSCIKAYFEGAWYQINYLVERNGDATKKEINEICPAHVLSLDVDDSKSFSYNTCVVTPEGKLQMVFAPDSLGTNVDYACQEDKLFPALNKATAPGDAKLSFTARNGIRQEWDPKVEEIQKKIAELVAKPEFTLDPNFDEVFAKLDAASKVKKSELRDDWQARLGSFTRQYFEGLVWSLGNMKVDEDDMVQEGFNEAVEKSKAVFRLVDKLKYDSYGEVEIEDGVLYLQATPNTWGTNVDYVAQKLMDRL